MAPLNEIQIEMSKIGYEISGMNRRLEELKKQAKDELIRQFATDILNEKEPLSHRDLSIILWDLANKLRDVETY